MVEHRLPTTPRAEMVFVALRLIGAPVFVVGVGGAALFHPTQAWASALLTIAVLMPLVMIVSAVFGSALGRPFRIGFAMGSGIYFLLFIFLQTEALENLATSKAIAYAYSKFFPNSPASPLPSWRQANGSNAPFSGVMGGAAGGAFDVAAKDNDADKGPADNANSNDPNMTDPFGNLPAPVQAAAGVNPEDEIIAAGNFWLIGQSLWTVVIGWLGGCFAQFLAWQQRRQKQNANLH